MPWNGDGERGSHPLDGVEDNLEVHGFGDDDGNGESLGVLGDARKGEPGSDPLAEGGDELGDGIGDIDIGERLQSDSVHHDEYAELCDDSECAPGGVCSKLIK